MNQKDGERKSDPRPLQAPPVPSQSLRGLRRSGSMCLWADAMTAWSPSSQVSLKQDDGQLSTRGLPLPSPQCPARTRSPFQASLTSVSHHAEPTRGCRHLLAFKTFRPQSPWRAVGSPEREPQKLEPSIIHSEHFFHFR